MKKNLLKFGFMLALAFATTVSLNSCGGDHAEEGDNTEATSEDGGDEAEDDEASTDGEMKCEPGKCQSGKCQGGDAMEGDSSAMHEEGEQKCEGNTEAEH